MGPQRMVVVGGTGFVGGHIVNAARRMGYQVTAVSRSGSKGGSSSPVQWLAGDGKPPVEWRNGDCFHPSGFRDLLERADCVVLCVGAFGSHRFMERVCGDANISVARAAVAANPSLQRLCFVSAACDFPFPLSAALKGYIAGKRKAEAAVQELLPPDRHLIIRPGMVYGPRSAGGITIPLQWVGAPLKCVLRPLHGATGLSVLTPPVAAEDVATVVCSPRCTGLVEGHEIERLARAA
eukprot:TRINITY_DN65677_c0_g1_i1.p2 TRINITY_DN65677_c0_g1~~TRINITY_DN65677_c0_g1_i1.p2  ORF type:complete len:265 (+),score=62.62 TRINITY_DN65677_c0_g1_i1:87-797(+)